MVDSQGEIKPSRRDFLKTAGLFLGGAAAAAGGAQVVNTLDKYLNGDPNDPKIQANPSETGAGAQTVQVENQGGGLIAQETSNEEKIKWETIKYGASIASLVKSPGDPSPDVIVYSGRGFMVSDREGGNVSAYYGENGGPEALIGAIVLGMVDIQEGGKYFVGSAREVKEYVSDPKNKIALKITGGNDLGGGVHWVKVERPGTEKPPEVWVCKSTDWGDAETYDKNNWVLEGQ